LQSLSHIKTLLESRGLRPKRSLGQNFLVDHNLIRKLVDASGVRPGDVVLEVGPGTGTMTEELLARGCRVVACELDDELAAILAETIGHDPANAGRFTLVHRDCLEGKDDLAPELIEAIRTASHAAGKQGVFHLVANLPYGAATPLMTNLLLDHPECPVLAVTIQREVADRLMAGPGSKDYGALAVIAQAMASVTRVALAPPECFWPRPEVTSAMVLLRRRADPLTTDHVGLSAFCRTIFAQRRKQIGSLLANSSAAPINWASFAENPPAGCGGIVPTLRAEQLTPAQVIALGRALGRIA